MSDGAPIVVAIGQSWNDLKIEELVLARAGARIVDGRNLYQPAQMAQLGFTYASVGRQTVTPK